MHNQLRKQNRGEKDKREIGQFAVETVIPKKQEVLTPNLAKDVIQLIS